jgi:hypothetical protein
VRRPAPAATPATERDPGGTDPVARMIAASPAALLCSDAAEEIFSVGSASAPTGPELVASRSAASTHAG